MSFKAAWGCYTLSAWHVDKWCHQFNLHNKYTFVLKKDQWLAGGMATAHDTAI